MKAFLVATLVLGLSTTLAQAKGHHRYTHHRNHQHYARIHHHQGHDQSAYLTHPAGCPWHDFCGCGVSVKVFGRIIDDLMLAWNWTKFPHASPAPGMVAVWRHHVAYIESYENGIALVYDPNSGGHKTREHHRSLAGAVIVNPRG